MTSRICTALLLVGSLWMGVSARPALADDWPQWRGPTRDGVWSETGLISKFAKPQLDAVWRVELGSGYSGPTVSDGRVYVMDRLERPTELERVHCFDAKTGSKLWSHQYEASYRDIMYKAGPRASVTIDDGRAYALGTVGHLHCYDAKTGEVIWKKDGSEEYKIRMPMWGITSSPIIEGDLVIVQIGGENGANLVAFDKKTGREKWRAVDDRPSYSAPIIIEHAGKRVLVCWTGDSVVGLDPQSGSVYWKHPFPPYKNVLGVASPVYHNGHIFLTGFYDGSMLLKLNPDKLEVEQVYHLRGRTERNSEAIQSIIMTPLIQDGHVYGIDAYGQARCLDMVTGKRIWESQEIVPRERWSTAHFIPNGDKVWIFTELGDLIISKLSPKGYEEISRTKVIKPTNKQERRGVVWTHPAFANKHIFIRNDEEMICASLAADQDQR